MLKASCFEQFIHIGTYTHIIIIAIVANTESKNMKNNENDDKNYNYICELNFIFY